MPDVRSPATQIGKSIKSSSFRPLATAGIKPFIIKEIRQNGDRLFITCLSSEVGNGEWSRVRRAATIVAENARAAWHKDRQPTRLDFLLFKILGREPGLGYNPMDLREKCFTARCYRTRIKSGKLVAGIDIGSIVPIPERHQACLALKRKKIPGLLQ